MVVKNNYNECITNLACSIRKYFNLDYKHNTLPYIDELLENKKPKNVVLLLFDGMGSNIIDNVLDKDAFLIKNRIKKITTVFPATTVAATTSILTGLNPVETGMLGWNSYYKDLDKVIVTFYNVEKGDKNKTVIDEAIKYRKKHMLEKTIIESINEKKEYKAYGFFPFGNNPYSDISDMLDSVIKLCNQDGKKYIYGYDDNPDGIMHVFGSDSKNAIEAIKYRNYLVEELSKKVKDTIIFVIADHGHTNVINIKLDDYPDITDCLIRNTSLESRTVSFFVKPKKKKDFVILFNKYFSDDFDLYSKEEVIESKLFGDGKENEIYRDSLGDYIAIAKANKCLLYHGDLDAKSQHAGYLDDEIYIPLIVIDRV